MLSPGRGGTQYPQVRSDMTLFTTHNHGACVAVGSVARSQALPAVKWREKDAHGARNRQSDKEKFRSDLNRPESCEMSERLLKTLRNSGEFQSEFLQWLVLRSSRGSCPIRRANWCRFRLGLVQGEAYSSQLASDRFLASPRSSGLDVSMWPPSTITLCICFHVRWIFANAAKDQICDLFRFRFRSTKAKPLLPRIIKIGCRGFSKALAEGGDESAWGIVTHVKRNSRDGLAFGESIQR
jgi:hypothetical protein